MVEGAGSVIFGVTLVTPRRKMNSSTASGLPAPHLAGGIGRLEFGLVPTLVAEPDAGRAQRQTLDPRREPVPVGGAAEFAVGDNLEPDLLLHSHHVADALVLDARVILFADLAGGMPPERLAQRGRPQQAADMIGAERRTVRRPLPSRRSTCGQALSQKSGLPKQECHCAFELTIDLTIRLAGATVASAAMPSKECGAAAGECDMTSATTKSSVRQDRARRFVPITSEACAAPKS